MASKLYTLAELSEVTGIPESTIRNYRKRFEDYIHTAQDGSRYPKYTDEAPEVLRMIARAYKQGMTHAEIARELNLNYAQSINHAQEPPESHQTALATISPAEALGIVAQAMQMIADQRNEVEALRAEVKELREAINSSSNTAATHQPPTDESGQQTQTQPATQPPNEPQPPAKRGFWRLFGKG